MKSNRSVQLFVTLSSVVMASLFTSAALAVTPYGPLAPGVPSLGPGLAPPSIVPGKEYSHDRDHRIDDTVALGTALEPERVVAWDGSGGVANGVTYAGSRIDFTNLSEVDAIANSLDALFGRLKADESHLIYSIDDSATSFSPGVGHLPVNVPSAGLLTLVNGNMIGGAGEISYELGTTGVSAVNPANEHGRWAALDDINNMPNPIDIDGIEVWGPEPGFVADADKYSLDVDTDSAGSPYGAVSVWHYDLNTGFSDPYIDHAMIASAVTAPHILGQMPTSLEPNAINLDALMVFDTAGDIDDFGRDDDGNIDEIIFSIRQIPDPNDPTGYYATGSELFVLNAAGQVSFLNHGGHDWDRAWALANMKVDQILIGDTFFFDVQLDINAIESITGGVVPEPGSMMLILLGVAALAGPRRRLG